MVLVLLVAAALPAPAADLAGRLEWVYDGDSIRVAHFGKVRLLGIDVPETEASQRDDFLLRRGVAATTLRQTATAARHYVQLLRGQTVRLQLPEVERDRYGRLLAYVYLPDGRLLNRSLIEEGLAVVYRRFDFTLKAEFIAAETLARQQQRGLWRLAVPLRKE
jgi:micrococcal nuclease